MHTTTSKLILSPLADAVSQLILIISESEISKTALPDLTSLAKVVSDHIANLVNIGTKIGNKQGADELLKQGMPIACRQVTEASELLLAGTKDLFLDPKSSAGKNKLLNAVKGILSGTTAVLHTFDDFEVRKIVQTCNLVQEKVKIIENVDSSSETQSLVQTITIASQSIVQLAQLTSKRVSEILSLYNRTRLESAVSTIQRESPVLINSLKVILQNPAEICAKAKNLSCSRLYDACTEIAVVVQIREESRVIDEPLLSNNSFPIHLQLLEDSGRKVFNSIVSNVPMSESKTLSDEYYSRLDKFEKSAGSVVNSLKVNSNVEEAAGLQEKLDALNSLLAISKSAISKLVNTPENNNSKILDTISKASESYKRFQKDIDYEIIAAFMDVFNTVSDSKDVTTLFGAMVKATDEGEENAKEFYREKFEKKCEFLDTLLAYIADGIALTSDITANEITIKTKKLRKLLPGLISAIDIRAVTSKDSYSQELLNNIICMWEDDIKNLQRIVFDAFDGYDIIISTELAASKLLRKLDSPRGSKEAVEFVNSLNRLSKQYILFLGREVENTDDEATKLNLLDNINSLENALPKHFENFMSILNADKFDSKELARIVQELNDLLASIGISIGLQDRDFPSSQGKRNSFLLPKLIEPAPELEISEIVDEVSESTDELSVSDRVVLVLFTAEEALSAPIAAAAREMMVEASIWGQKGNNIIKLIENIAKNMNRLSESHAVLKNKVNAESKAGFIRASQDILSQVSALLVPAKELLDKCTDKRLRKQLSNTLDQIMTTSQQLKIVATVKASAPSDIDNDHQLITCAQNLVKLVKSCLHECESCSLRQGTVAIDSSKPKKPFFKRAIYKRLNLQLK